MWNKLVDKHLLKFLSSEFADSSKLEVVGQSVGHHNDERFDLSVGYQVVHYQSGVSLLAPASLVLAPSVLQVEHRESLLLCLGTLANQLSVCRWQINHCGLHLAKTL